MELKTEALTAAINDALQKLVPGHAPVTIEPYKEDISGIEQIVVCLNTNYTSNWRLENITSRICLSPKGHMAIQANPNTGNIELFIRKGNIKPVYFTKDAAENE